MKLTVRTPFCTIILDEFISPLRPVDPEKFTTFNVNEFMEKAAKLAQSNSTAFMNDFKSFFSTEFPIIMQSLKQSGHEQDIVRSVAHAGVNLLRKYIKNKAKKPLKDEEKDFYQEVLQFIEANEFWEEDNTMHFGTNVGEPFPPVN